MKKHSTRLLSILLGVIMLMTVFVSCGKTETTEDTGAVADTSAAIVTETEVITEYKLDDLGTLNLNTEINVLAWKDVEHEEFEAESTTGDIINDAIYTRNATVENRLGIKINWYRENGDSDYVSAWNQVVGNAIKSGDHQYDVLAGYSLSIANNATNGYLANLLNEDKFTYINFEQPWWSELLVEQTTINGKLFFASGDISRNLLEMMYVTFVNTDLLETHNLENPQDLVEKNEWTYEKFIQMCSGVYSGDGTKNELTDTFGYMSSGIHVDPWFYGSGALICSINEEGDLVESESFFSEKVVDTIDMLIALFDSQDAIRDSSAGKHQEGFRDGRILFITDRARTSHKVLADNADLNFVVVPFPKYNTDQERYYTVVGNPFTLYAIMSDCQKTEEASAFLECMASEGYRTVTPTVYEISLKTKYVSDAISGKMYDLIKESVIYDPGRLFNAALSSQSYFKNAVAKTTNTWASGHAAIANSLKTGLKKLNKAFNNISD